MNTLSLPGAPAWFDALLVLSAQATLLAGIVWVILKLLGRWIPPNWRALLWFVVIARVLIPIAPPSAFSLQNIFVKANTATPSPALSPRVEFPDASQEIDLRITSRALNSMVFPETKALPRKPIQKPINPSKALALIWASGAILFLTLLVGRSFMIRRRLVRNSFASDSKILETIDNCRAQLRLRFPIRIVISDRIAAPALTGLIPARLILPTHFASGQFTPDQIRQILLHEFAHIRQGHLFLHWLALIARCLQWFNPVIHFAASRLRHECELAADAAVLKNSTPDQRAAYGETILQVLAQSTSPSTVLALGMADQARHLKERLSALATPANRSFHTLGIILIGIMAATGLTNSIPPQPTIPLKADSEIIEKYRDRMTSRPTVHSKNALAFATSRELSPTPNPIAENRASASPSRRVIYRKLETIRIDRFPLEEETDLVDILKQLNIEIRQRDPSESGVNFIMSQSVESSNELRKIDVGKFKIKFDPPIHDLTLGQFLDAVIRVAKPPQGAPSTAGLKYSVEDYAVVFDHHNADATEQYVSRSFRVNPNAFRQGLEGVFFTSNPFQGLGGSESEAASLPSRHSQTSQTIPAEVRAFFIAAGVDFPTNNIAVGDAVPAGFGLGPGYVHSKALFFNDRAGILFVRAPLGDLEIIENAIHALNSTPPQVTIEAKFAEFKQSEISDFGFESFLGNISSANGSIGLQNITNSQTTPTVGTATAVMTESQSRTAFKAIENRTGVDLVSAPKVTTISGRQVRISSENPSGIYRSPITSQPSSVGPAKTNNGVVTSGKTPPSGREPAELEAKPETDKADTESEFHEPLGVKRSELLTSTDYAQKLIQSGQVEEAERLLQHAVDSGTVNSLAFQDTTALGPTRYALPSEPFKPAAKKNSAAVPSPEIPPSALARQKLNQKIDSIRIDNFPLTTPVDLIEVVKQLSFETRNLDPEHRGINFVLDKAKGRAANVDIELERFKIKIDPPIRDVTVRQLCDVIARVAAPPPGASGTATLAYSVEDYGVVFSVAIRNPEAFASRSYRVSPNNFRSAMDAAYPLKKGEDRLTGAQRQLRDFLTAAGVDFVTNNVAVGGSVSKDFGVAPTGQPTKAAFYNDLTGTLFVRAPVSDLDTVEHAIHKLNMAPPQVCISTEIYELSKEEAAQIQKDFPTANALSVTNEFLFGAKSGENSTVPTLLASKSISERLKQPVIATNLLHPASHFILAEDAATKLRKHLQSAKEVDGLTMPNVTTLLGREARVSQEESSTIVTGTSTNYFGAMEPLGWSVDCIPQSFNGRELQLSSYATRSEFLGYQKEGDLPLPRFRIRQTGSPVKLPPGDTQALLFPVTNIKRVPVLGDIPNLGRLFQTADDSRYNLILITPTIIDAAGNRVFPKSE